MNKTTKVSNFVYFNPSPTYKEPKAGRQPKKHKLGDCAVRAVCKATGVDWLTVYDTMSASARKVFAPFNTTEGFEQVMHDLCFEKISYPKGQKRETVAEFCINHPDITAILNLAGHYVCVQNGKYYDTWDCANCTAYNYYKKI